MPQHTCEGRSQLLGASCLPPCEIQGQPGWADSGDTFTCWASQSSPLGFHVKLPRNCTWNSLHFVGIVNRPGYHQLHPHRSWQLPVFALSGRRLSLGASHTIWRERLYQHFLQKQNRRNDTWDLFGWLTSCGLTIPTTAVSKQEAQESNSCSVGPAWGWTS